MVRLLLLFVLFTCNLAAQDLGRVIVTSEMNYTQLITGIPLSGTVTITHDKSVKIDPESFKVGTKPLKVKFLNDVVISESSPLIISIYSFEIPSMPKGLHILPEISVQAGGKTYKSYSTTFEVLDQESAPQATQPSNPNRTAVTTSINPQPPIVTGPSIIPNTTLSLETKVDGPKKLYPGQEINVTYRFIYKGHIELIKESLPLLDFPGLKKVGDKLTKDYMENDLNVAEFSQKYIAENSGIFPSGPSIVEGRPYQETAGKRIYATTTLKSENPPVIIEVLPFPKADRPASFNGSLGSYTFKAGLKGKNTFTPGEKLLLLLEVVGDPAFLPTAQAPDLCCQPRFSGNFKPSDLPPISTIIGNTKQFLVELTPLSSTLTEIPPIEFSSFDPTLGKFLISKSPAIPIVLNTSTTPNTSINKDEEIPAISEEILKTPSPIEISALFPLTKSDLYNSFFASFWNLLFIPVFIVLLITQVHFKEGDILKPALKETPSEELFKSALSKEANSAEFYKQLEQSFMMALKEKGVIDSVEIAPENLEKTGLAGDVRIFLTRLEEVRFSGIKSYNLAIISSAKELYQKITGITIS